MITLKEIYQLEAHIIGFVQSYPPTDVKVNIFLEISPGMQNSSSKDYVLKLLKNVYRLKDEGKTWWDDLDQDLSKREFKPSTSDQSVHLQNGYVILTYVDNILIFVNKNKIIDTLYKSLKNNFSVIDEEKIDKYPGVKFSKQKYRSSVLTQHPLVDRIIKFIPGLEERNLCHIPLNSNSLLINNGNGESRKWT